MAIHGIIIGGMITIIFAAANVYLGLKADLTFMTSIPVAITSMAILRYSKDRNVQENNIVQIIVSAAGTPSVIIFVLPGLVMIGWWQDPPYWQSIAVVALGGVLGVMYSVPLRRALITHPDLPYPEGVVAAEVLRVGNFAEGEGEPRQDFLAIIRGAVISPGFAILSPAKTVGTEIGTVFAVSTSGTMAFASLSFALLGIGYLVGVAVGITMVVGLFISYGVLLPTRSRGLAGDPANALELVSTISRSEVRLIGAGAIAVAAVWTLLKLLVPIIGRVRDSLAPLSKRAPGEAFPLNEQDLSGKVVVGVTIRSMPSVGVLLWLFLKDTPLVHYWIGLVLVSILFILITSPAIASVRRYMAGLIGVPDFSTSGVGILVAVATALVMKAVHGTITGDELSVLVAYTLFTAALVFGIATVSNDNPQDLRTGQLVGATPWKQQPALIIGVGFGAITVPPVLSLMHRALGFQGAPDARQNALAAPQISLTPDFIKGVFGGDLNWDFLETGAFIGMIVIIIDEAFKRAAKRLSLPDLTVGMGMCLLMVTTTVIPIGALLGLLHGQWAKRQTDPEKAKRMGTLVATGLIVGGSLQGVACVGIVGSSGKGMPLAFFGESSATPAQWIGTVLSVVTATYLYKDMRPKAKAH